MVWDWYIKSKLQYSCIRFIKKPKISSKTEEWILESGWSVLFKHKVSNPGKAIPDNEDKQELNKSETRKDESNKLQDSECGSNHMEPSAGGVSVL